MDSRDDIMKRDWSKEFITKMENAIETSHYKYGWMSDTYPELAQAVKCILVDIANFAMIEYKHPAYSDAHYTPQDSDKSPGLAGGTSYRELMEAYS